MLLAFQAPSEHIHEIPANEIHRRHKKLRLTGQDLSANPTTPTGISNNDENQNVVPTQRRSVSDRQQTSSSRFEWSLCASATVHKRSLDEQHAEEAVKDDPKQVEPSPEFLETIIVSDSEESDDEGDPPSQFLRKKIVWDIVLAWAEKRTRSTVNLPQFWSRAQLYYTKLYSNLLFWGIDMIYKSNSKMLPCIRCDAFRTIIWFHR